MIADTTFLVDLLRGKKEAVKFLDKLEKPLKTTIMNQYEIFLGITRLSRLDIEEKIEKTKLFFDNFEILQLNEDSMLESAKICGRLLQKGEEIGDNDCLIAGIARKNGINTIITRNKSHFTRIDGIKVMSY